MEKQLSYVLMPSLEQLALGRIAVAFYSEPRMLASITTLSEFVSSRKFPNIWEPTDRVQEDYSIANLRRAVEDKMAEFCYQLQLPKSLAKLLMPLLKAVGSSICTWKSIHEKHFGKLMSRQRESLQNLCWATVGTVDYRRTAEQLVHCEALDIVTRFELACWYCLNSYIPLLWNKLPDEKKGSFCDVRVVTPHLDDFLPCILAKQSRIRSEHTMTAFNSFEEAAFYGNKTLAEYFFRKLSKEEREASLVRTAKNLIRIRNDEYPFDVRTEQVSDTVCYLLSLMTPQEQVGIFMELPCEVLRCFLDWPWQDLSLDIAGVIWNFLPESRYGDLVRTIFISIDSSGYYFPNIFQNLFLSGPRQFRKLFVDDGNWRNYFFWYFSINEDTETIRVIMRNIDAADRVRLVFYEESLDLIYQPVQKWHVKETFLREAKLSKEDKQKLKKDFMALLKRYRCIQWAREEHGRFFDFLEERPVE